MKYVALLRGINVGGNAIIKMAELKTCVAELGHANVRTYIASGNVLFESPERSGAKLESAFEHAIERAFGHSVRAVVRSRTEIERIAAHIPAHWIGDDDRRVSVAYLMREGDARTIAKGLKPKAGIDELVVAPGALIWAIRRDALTRTGLKLIGTPVYKLMTIRNVNTALKLAELVAA
ncbi:MAG TPA: DUF1697 domain-containing protein [Gaiellaceae bacterium]|nr:DUF1697 domain-containing protein [Gaiellaceae bacterium]